MSEFEEALQKIFEIFESGEETKKSDWSVIMDSLCGKNDAETISNIQNFVEKEKYFSFKIADGAEGYVYYGMVNQNTPAFQVVDGMVKSADGSYAYISSTKAGKLFNDTGFTEAVRDILIEPSLKNKRNNLIFNGTNASGTIQFSDGTSAQAFNDFFSQNYIENLTCSNVRTLISGDYTMNCFGRTEFLKILENTNIKTINGIDKNVLLIYITLLLMKTKCHIYAMY